MQQGESEDPMYENLEYGDKNESLISLVNI